jgi:hypothetical protein
MAALASMVMHPMDAQTQVRPTKSYQTHGLVF